MINILLPSMGKSLFFKDSFFPKPLIEIENSTILEHVVDNYKEIDDSKIIFIFGDKDCKEFHLDESAKILTGDKGEAIVLNGETEGALCTCMMAIEHINNDNPLIVANADQVVDVDFNDVIKSFENCDAGLITFPSIHPRWSYAKVSGEDVVEVAEKRPLSHEAIAGFYYYKKGSDFIEAAKRAISKQATHEGRYYISSTINELILMNKKVTRYTIDKEQYHSFYSPEKIKEYEGGRE